MILISAFIAAWLTLSIGAGLVLARAIVLNAEQGPLEPVATPRLLAVAVAEIAEHRVLGHAN